MVAWPLPLSLLAAALSAAPPAAFPERQFVDWPSAPGAPVAVDGLTLVNTSRACTPRDSADREPGHCWVAGVRIERPGAVSVTLEGPAGMVARIAIGPMTRGAAPAVILSSFTGGAHCCEVYDVAMPAARGWRTTRVTWTAAAWTGGTGPQTQFDGGLAGFPSDLDGDGVADFVLSDDRFDYTFSSYAGSAPPPIVLNWINGRWTDVSASPRFASLFARQLADRRQACIASDNGEPRGVCAGYAADAARLGRFAQAWPVVLAHTGTSAGLADNDLTRCPVAFVDGRCPPGRQVVYKDYAAMLRAFLTVTGYLPPDRHR